MFCSKCGNQVPDGQNFCPQCGAPTASQTNSAPNYQQPYTQDVQYTAAVQPTYAPPMNWYKFLIYFSLFAGAIINGISAINFLTGSVYDGAANLAYRFYDGLQVLDILYSLGCIAAVALAIYTRQLLAKYSAKGPKMLTNLYLLTMGITIIYLIGFLAITGADEGAAIGSVIFNIIVSAIMIFVNKAYFDKRAHLFVN